MMVLPQSRPRGLPSKSHVIFLSLALNALLALTLFFFLSIRDLSAWTGQLRSETHVWHGGHPADRQTGSCWCSDRDGYCMCTPSLAIDLIIVSGKNYFWLVRRKDTNQLATMGGFVNVGETVEAAVKRELHEEMGIVLSDIQSPILFGVYSDPKRDNRRHTVSVVYVIHLDGSERPKPADDVKEVKRVIFDEVEKYEYFADHKTILRDYVREMKRSYETGRMEQDAAVGVQQKDTEAFTRSFCTSDRRLFE